MSQWHNFEKHNGSYQRKQPKITSRKWSEWGKTQWHCSQSFSGDPHVIGVCRKSGRWFKKLRCTIILRNKNLPPLNLQRVDTSHLLASMATGFSSYEKAPDIMLLSSLPHWTVLLWLHQISRNSNGTKDEWIQLYNWSGEISKTSYKSFTHFTTFLLAEN